MTINNHTHKADGKGVCIRTGGGLCVGISPVDQEQLDDVNVTAARGRHQGRDVTFNPPVLHIGMHGQQHLTTNHSRGQSSYIYIVCCRDCGGLNRILT